MINLRIMIAALLLAAPFPAHADKELVVDLSKSVVAITTGFTGSDLLLFGATEGEGDVVVAVRGPRRDEIVRRKRRVAGVWINRESMSFQQVPGYYAIAASRPIGELINEKQRAKYRIGVDFLDLKPNGKDLSGPRDEDATAFRQALIRNKQRQGLYGRHPGDVIFLGNRLFRSQLHFPANVAVGAYTVDVYLVREGAVTSVETTLLTVRKFGFEAGVYGFAHRHSMAYGVLAIIIAVMAGWLAGAIFRKA